MDSEQTDGNNPPTEQDSDIRSQWVSHSEIDEYAIRERLGRGGFGTVYLAWDRTLQREVALKIPHSRHLSKLESVELYLREARATASLEHPSIIPVYRAAKTHDIPCYIVSKRIRGCHLGQWNARNRPTYATLTRILAQISDALGYAHKRGVVHRDIKPSNILVDEHDHPYVADFGLALRDVDPKGGPTYAGTPSYMSPEQARGEGHRVDGRSDIFSMGVLMYELLCGVRPFRGSDKAELFEAILYNDPEPPDRLNPEIPPELASICLKCLSKSIADRYQSADTLAAELRAANVPEGSTGMASHHAAGDSTDKGETQTAVGSNRHEQRVVPKGLRPFDLRDADFFLKLLPGPRDREGMPEIIRFWLSRINRSGSDRPVTVGLIYGPSGCGKTSLVRAGLLPRLPTGVDSIYLQATADETEKHLLERVVARLDPTSHSTTEPANLADAFAHLRRQRKKKIVIFIDQFEQWLFAHPDVAREPLTQALRQCDGEFVQCVLMVRDDFWMGVTRLMQAIDLPVAENVNMTAVDLFDPRHARNVLRLFGIAYGRLSETSTPTQERFLDAAVEYLSKDGRVVCVQLALLTEMLKDRSWDKSTALFHDEGADIGMHFLEETFDSEHAPRRTRIHAEGTVRVLRALLPEPGSRIKGAIRTKDALLEASGYHDPLQFRELIGILDREFHLITPTDRNETDSASGSDSESGSGPVGFQLTHDFLIAPVRRWTEYHNRGSREGKARLRLDEFAEHYKLRPRPQSLPTISEYLGIRRYIRPTTYTASQRRVMTAARNRHLRSVGTWLLVLALLAAGGFAAYERIERRNLATTIRSEVAHLIDANMVEAVALVDELRPSALARREAMSIVEAEDESLARRVRASLLIAENDRKAARLLTEFAFEGPVGDVIALARGFDPAVGNLGDKAAAVWLDQTAPRDTLLRAACIIANDSEHVELLRDPESIERLVRLIVAENPLRIQQWSIAFQPISDALVPRLQRFVNDPTRSDGSPNAVNMLIHYARDDVALLASLLPSSRPAESAALTEALALHGEVGADAVLHEWKNESTASEQEIDLARPWGSPWWCVGKREPLETVPDAKPLTESLQRQLDETEAVIAKHAVIAHKVPRDGLEQLDGDLSSAGYRIASLSHYETAEDAYVAAVWLRDSASSRLVVGVTADGLRSKNEENRNAGFLPDAITAFRGHGQTTPSYSGIWTKVPENRSGVIDADLYLDLHQDKHEQKGWAPMGERGLRLPRSNLLVRNDEGTNFFSSVRWQTERHVGYRDAWNMDWEENLAARRYSRSLVTVQNQSALMPEDVSAGTTPIWWSNLPIESSYLEYQPRQEHVRSAEEQIERGYYPVSIHTTDSEQDRGPVFCSVWWRGTADVDERVAQSKRIANLVVALFQLGHHDQMKASLVGLQRSALRGAVVAAFAEHDLDPAWLVQRLFDNDASPVLRRSCAMALALYSPASLSQSLQDGLRTKLPPIYTSASDPGLRSAIESIALRWKVELAANDDADAEKRSPAGHRLVVIDPKNPVWLGSPSGEPGRDPAKEPLRAVNLPVKYAIATREVTVADFLKFNPDHAYAKDYSGTDDCPIINVTWFDAAKYCRWLSEEEHIPESEMCYPEIDKIQPGMQLDPDFGKRTGYRLPTEAEWEYACRGGVDARRWFGFDPDRLDDIAWTARNSDYRSKPVGQLLPNDFGLFDMLGNAMEWCHASFVTYPPFATEPIVDPGLGVLRIDGDTLMVNRGSASSYQPLDARSSQRNSHPASYDRVYVTFRIARTINANFP